MVLISALRRPDGDLGAYRGRVGGGGPGGLPQLLGAQRRDKLLGFGRDTAPAVGLEGLGNLGDQQRSGGRGGGADASSTRVSRLVSSSKAARAGGGTRALGGAAAACAGCAPRSGSCARGCVP